MYQISAPVFARMLGNLAAILRKAEANAAERKIDTAILLADRLSPDMLPLSAQIQIATDSVKGCVARLAGIEVPAYPDTEKTLEELQARIAKTIAFVESVRADQIDGTEAKPIELKFPGRTINFTGESFVCNFVLPNFYFHVTTAYAILRHNGVPLGKMDFLGSV